MSFITFSIRFIRIDYVQFTSTKMTNASIMSLSQIQRQTFLVFHVNFCQYRNSILCKSFDKLVKLIRINWWKRQIHRELKNQRTRQGKSDKLFNLMQSFQLTPRLECFFFYSALLHQTLQNAHSIRQKCQTQLSWHWMKCNKRKRKSKKQILFPLQNDKWNELKIEIAKRILCCVYANTFQTLKTDFQFLRKYKMTQTHSHAAIVHESTFHSPCN